MQGDARLLLAMILMAGCAPTNPGPERICDAPETCAASPSVVPEPPAAARFACDDELVDLYAGRAGHVREARFTTDDTTIAVNQFDVVELWKPGMGEPSATCWGHRGVVLDIDVRGQVLASVGLDGTAWLWDAGTCSEQLALDPVPGKLTQIVLSHDGRYVAASGERHAHLWSVDERAPVSVVEHEDITANTIVTIAFGRARPELFTSDRQGFVKVTSPGAEPTTILHRPESVAVAPLLIDGEEYLALVGDTVGVWRREDGSYTEAGEAYAAWEPGPRVSPDQRHLLALGLSTAKTSAAKLWSLPDARLVVSIEGMALDTAEFSPDGVYFALARDDRLHLHRITDGVEVDAVDLPNHRVEGVERMSFSADSRHLVVAMSGYFRGTAYLWCPKLEESTQ